MAKISDLPEVVAPDGDETAVVLKDGVAKRVPMRPLVEAAADQVLDQAGALRDQAAANADLASHFANDATNADIVGAPAGARGARYWAQQAAASAATIAGLIARYVKYPGWFMAIKGSGRRLVWGIKDSGTVWSYLAEIVTLTVSRVLIVSGRVQVGSAALKPGGTYPGVLWAYIDARRRRVWALLTDGTIWAYRARTELLTAGTIRIGSASVSNATWVVYTAPAANGDYQVYKQHRQTGQVTALTSTGNHTELKLSGSQVTWLTNGNYSEYCDLDTGATGRAVAKPLLVAIGHSMLANYNASRQPPLPQRVADLLNWDLVNYAIQGQGSAQQVARLGLVQTTLVVDGNTVPASGPVVVTSPTPSDFIFSAYGQRAIWGWLGGVYGYLTWDATAGVVERFWRANPGDPVAMASPATWVPDMGDSFNGTYLIWSFVNDGLYNTPVPAASVANLNLMIASMKALGRRFVLLTELNNYAQPSGSAAYTNIMAWNAYIKATYPNNVVDARQILVDGYNPALPDDVTAHAQDRPAPSLLDGDVFHPANAGNALLAPAIANFIKSKGWA